MSQRDSSGVVGQLVKLGFTDYQAKVYQHSCLWESGASLRYTDAQESQGTKVYEALEDLIRQGAVELQAGRPALYRAVHPKSLMARLVEDYRRLGQ